MIQDTMKAVVCERLLRLETDPSRKVVVQIAAPQVNSSGSYECAYRIEGLGDGALHRAGGIDSMQALQVAIQSVRRLLQPQVNELRWDGGDAPGAIGFPMEVPEFFGRRFAAKLERVIQLETDKYGRMLERHHTPRKPRTTKRSNNRRRAGGRSKPKT